MSKLFNANFFIGLATLIILGASLWAYKMGYGTENKSPETDGKNLEGKQVIEIKAKGGYSPTNINARANEDTVLKIKTNNTFDCSTAFTIPKLKIRKNLPPTGETYISLGAQPVGSKILGTCSMGMYRFNINFN